MKHPDAMPLTPGDRDRALGLLRRISVSAGIGSLLAVGGLGYAAAASYSGKHVVASTTVAAVSSATPSAAASTAASAATSAPTIAATPAPAAATAPPVATSGGS